MSDPSHKSQSEMRTLVTDEYRDNYDAIFGKKEPTRGKFVFDTEKHTYVPIEEYVPKEPASGRVPVATDLYMDGTRAVDGTDIGSRAKRREYMNQRGLADADDFKGVWKDAEKKREAHYRGTDPEQKKARREALGRAAYELKSKARRKK